MYVYFFHNTHFIPIVKKNCTKSIFLHQNELTSNSISLQIF